MGLGGASGDGLKRSRPPGCACRRSLGSVWAEPSPRKAVLKAQANSRAITGLGRDLVPISLGPEPIL